MANEHGAAPHGGAGEKKNATRQGVAIIGFIIVAILGISIAVYASRFVPGAISGLAGAGAYVSNLFILEDEAGEPIIDEVAPEDEDPIIEEDPVSPEPTDPEDAPEPSKPGTPTYSGFPDLTTSIIAVGFCTAQNAFVPASSVPSNARYGAQFALSNIGTNIASGWYYSVITPDGTRLQQPGVTLYPSRSATGVTCFSLENGNDEIEVSIDTNGAVTESNERNNTVSHAITGRGNNSNSNDDLWCDITASDRSIDEGDSTTLRFDIEGADDARINQGVGSVDEDGGTERVRPTRDTRYTLTVENNDGDEETCSVTINVDED